MLATGCRLCMPIYGRSSANHNHLQTDFRETKHWICRTYRNITDGQIFPQIYLNRNSFRNQNEIAILAIWSFIRRSSGGLKSYDQVSRSCEFHEPQMSCKSLLMKDSLYRDIEGSATLLHNYIGGHRNGRSINEPMSMLSASVTSSATPGYFIFIMQRNDFWNAPPRVLSWTQGLPQLHSPVNMARLLQRLYLSRMTAFKDALMTRLGQFGCNTCWDDLMALTGRTKLSDIK